MTDLIEATYRVVTPMFCSGADSNSPELRAASFKGVLRFWWRALAWSRLDGDLGRICAEETALFGGPGQGSRVSMCLVPPTQELDVVEAPHVLTARPGAREPVGVGVRYLGYGLMEAFYRGRIERHRVATEAGQLIRACYRAPFEFTVRMRCRGLQDAATDELVRALRAVGLFGGLGSRTRRGFGSLTLTKLSVDRQRSPEDVGDAMTPKSEITRLLAPTRRGGEPSYTAFSSESRAILAVGKGASALDLLDCVGREMILYRSAGQQWILTSLGGIDSERNFVGDHNLVKQHAPQRASAPLRIAFGLPLGDFAPGRDPGSKSGTELVRRASPLFIHIDERPAGCTAILLFLPATFLPRGTGIRVDATHKDPREVSGIDPQTLWDPVNGFLDRFATGKCKESFGQTSEVQL